jgi:glutamate-1-semialdehyde 2,1-aminomutase
MHALRIARVATGRQKIAKMRGGYHGTYDPSLISNYRWKDPDHVPPGLADGTVENTILLHYNDIAATTALVERHAADLAALIVEPVIGGSGMIPADRDFLVTLRELTRRHGIVLIFDEMVTFTYGPHGAQGHYGVTPDLTTLGKAIGGGLPLAAFGGSAALMDLCDGAVHGGVPPVRHAATFGGIPISLAAGIACVEQLTPAVHAKLHRLGARVRAGIDDLGRRYEIPLRSTGAAHYFCLQWTPTPVVDFDTALSSDREIVGDIVLALNNEGFMLFYSNGVGLMSEPMDDTHADGFLAALERSIRALGLVSGG